MTPAFFYASADIVVVGQNSEFADYDNPRGYLYGFAAFVYAEALDGTRCRLHISTETRESAALQPAQEMADALNTRLKNGKLPVAFDQWQETFPAYGSAAYSEIDTIEWERSLED
jgi:hypothetical protein